MKFLRKFKKMTSLPFLFQGTIMVDQNVLGFAIPSLSLVLTWLIRFFFIAAGLLALFNLLLGAVSWITSGGSKEGTEKARAKIQAAVIGVILIVVVLSVVVALEQIVFRQAICFGISCGISIPALIAPVGTVPPGATDAASLYVTPIPDLPSDQYGAYVTSTPIPGGPSPVPTITLDPNGEVLGNPNDGAINWILEEPTLTPQPK